MWCKTTRTGLLLNFDAFMLHEMEIWLNIELLNGAKGQSMLSLMACQPVFLDLFQT